MSENGKIYTAGKNFTLPPAVTAWTNSTSERALEGTPSVLMIQGSQNVLFKTVRPSSLIGAILDATNLALRFHIEEVSVAHVNGVLVDHMHGVLLRPKDLVFHTCFRGPNLSIF